MIWRLIGLACCVVLYGVAWVAEAAGARVLLAPLLVVPVLIFLIAAGNWLQHWLGIERPSPKFTQVVTREDHDASECEQP